MNLVELIKNIYREIFDVYDIRIVIICLIIVFIVFLWGLYKGIQTGNHALKWNQAKRVYKKIQTIEEPMAALGYLRKINAYVYEELILYALQRAGYKIKRNKKYSGDGGIDGKVKIAGKWHYIQAKRYKNHINKQHVIEFNAITKRDNVKGLFVHTGRTGSGTKIIIEPHVRMISGKNMVDLIKGKFKN